MNRLLVCSCVLSGLVAAAHAQIAPGPNPDAGTLRQPADGPQPTPMDEAALRQRMAESAVGRLAIQAVQGTPEGPAIGSTSFEILLVHRGQVVHSQTGDLDEHGVAVVEGLPVAMEVTPVVQVAYDGVFYQNTGEPLSPQNAESKVEITVYETTDERPDWHIKMRHVRVQATDQGLLVSEMIMTENPGNRTWLGQPMDATPDAKRDAAQFMLPKGATDVQLQAGFHGWCCTRLDDAGTMSVQMPMMPGEAQYRFAYVLPVSSAQASLLVSAPVETKHMIAFLQDDGAQIEADGLQDEGSQAMGATNMRMFQAQAIPANQPTGLRFSGLTSAVDLQAVSDTNSQIKVFAAIGGGLVLLAGIVVIFMKAPRQAHAAG